MWTLLYPFFQWCDETRIGLAIRDSRLLFPIIETFHLFALTILIGSLVVLNLRLFGLIMRTQPVVQLKKDLAPFIYGGLIVMLLSGSLLFLSEPLKCYDSSSFRVKMILLFFTLIYQFTIYRKATNPDEVRPLWGWVAGGISLALWFGVGLAGRGIGFL